MYRYIEDSLVCERGASEFLPAAASLLSGVYYSTDGGVLWQYLNQELPVRNINNLALSQNGSVLYAGINGRGVFRLSAHPLEP